MSKLFKNLFALPSHKAFAAKKLQEHELELVEARRRSQLAQMLVIYHENVIKDLKNSLNSQEQTNDA